jgi:dihydrofolate reductase
MRKLISINSVSLDGIMQSPGGPQEDPRNGFTLGGWIAPYWDGQMGERLEQTVSGALDLLFGRRTYEMLAAYWPYAGENPIADGFNRARALVRRRRTGASVEACGNRTIVNGRHHQPLSAGRSGQARPVRHGPAFQGRTGTPPASGGRGSLNSAIAVVRTSVNRERVGPQAGLLERSPEIARMVAAMTHSFEE